MDSKKIGTDSVVIGSTSPFTSLSPLSPSLPAFPPSAQAAPEERGAGLLAISHVDYPAFAPWQRWEKQLSFQEYCIIAVERGSVYVNADALQGMLSRGQIGLLAATVPSVTSSTIPPAPLITPSPTLPTPPIVTTSTTPAVSASASSESVYLTPQESCSGILLTLRGTVAASLFAQQQEEQRVFCAHALPVIVEAVKQLQSALTPEEQSLAAYPLLLHLHQHGECFPGAVSCPPLVEAALGILEEEFAQVDGIEEIADRLGVTSNHLIRQFSGYIGIPPGKYLKMRRLHYAKELLQQPDISVSLAAELSGFSNANYFAKVFRKETGMSPTEYSASHRGRRMSTHIKKQLDSLYL